MPSSCVLKFNGLYGGDYSVAQYEMDTKKRERKFHPAEKRNEKFKGTRGLPRGPMTELLLAMKSASADTLDTVRAAMKAVQDADLSDTSCVANRSIGSEDKMTCLAVGVCDSSVVKLLMSFGGNPNKQDELGRNALHHLARLHLRTGDTNSKIFSISKISAKTPRPTDKYPYNPASGTRASYELSIDIIHSARMHEVYPIEWNVQDDFKRTPLHYAAENGNMQTIHYLVDNCQAKLQVLDNTLLFAWENTRTDEVKKRIKDAINGRAYVKDLPVTMLFHMFTLSPEEIESPSSMDELRLYGMTKGKSVNEMSPEGQTALHYAASRNAVPQAQYLLKVHADPHIRDKYSQLPIDLAKHNEMKELLQEAMMKPQPPTKLKPAAKPTAKPESNLDSEDDDDDCDDDDSEDDSDTDLDSI